MTWLLPGQINLIMPKLTFVSENLTIDIPAGTLLQDAVELAKSSFPFGCRMGSCGTCRCVVLEGAENVNDLTDEENLLFESLTSVGKNERLGCQLTINGDVKIRA